MKNKKPDLICATPFLQLMLTPNGDVRVCCLREDLVLGNIKDKSLLDDLWNHEKIQKLRKEFLDSNPVSCAHNIRRFNCNKRFSNLDKFIEYKEIQTQPPRKFDLRLNGQCNLECIMCSFWQQPNDAYKDSDFWIRGPKEIFPHLVQLEILGGEPFIQKDTFKLIDEVSAVNKDCLWVFTTNGHWKLNTTVMSKLDKIKIREIRFSIDSINPDTFKKIRLKGDLDKAIKTLKDVQEYQKIRTERGNGFKIGLDMAIQVLNAEEIPEFIEFAEDIKVDHIGIIPVIIPVEHSIFNKSVEYKKMLLEKYINCFKEHKHFALESLIWTLKEYVYSKKTL